MDITAKDYKKLDDYFSTCDETLLDLAITLYGKNILRYCNSILCDYHEAEEVTQDIFIKAYKKKSKFKDGTSFSSWLYKIAYRTCIDNLRKKKFHLYLTKDIKSYTLNSPPSGISDELKEALLKIPPKDRALIFSRVFDKKDFKELEIIYNVSSQTLRKRYERAKKKLAKILKENKFNI